MKATYNCDLRGWDSCIAPFSNDLSSMDAWLKNQSVAQSVMSQLVANLSDKVSSQQSVIAALKENIAQLLRSMTLQQQEITDLKTVLSAVLRNETLAGQAQSELSSSLAANSRHDIFVAGTLFILVLTVMAMFCHWASDLIDRVDFQQNVIDTTRKNLGSVVKTWSVLQNISLCVNKLALISKKGSNSNTIGAAGHLLEATVPNSYLDKRITLPGIRVIPLPKNRKKSLCEKMWAFFSEHTEHNNDQNDSGGAYSPV